MSIEELAFKDRKILANLNAVDLLNIIEFLQDDRRQCLEELSKTHNRSVEIQKENQELKSQLAGTTHCFDEEEHNKLKEENQELKKQLEVGNKQYSDLVEEKEILQEQLSIKTLQLEELKSSKRDYTQENILEMKMFKLQTQQKEFINYLEDEIKELQKIKETELDYDILKDVIPELLVFEDVLQKHKEIIGVSDENNKQ